MSGKCTICLGILVAVVAYCFMSGEKFNPDSVKGKTVLVTGASTGIGEQLAYNYAKLGARIIITARSEDLLQKVAKECRKLGAEQVEVVKADMKITEHRNNVINAVKNMGSLDILVLNHAIMTSFLWQGQDNLTTFNDMNTINFVSFVDIASRLLPLLAKSNGHIGVVSSAAGKMACTKMAVYSANKFALHGFFASLRQDLRLQGVDVSVTLAVLGLIDTDTARSHMKEMKNSGDVMWKFSATADETALEIIKAISTRKYELYYPFFAKFIITLHKFFPDSLEDMFADYAY